MAKYKKTVLKELADTPLAKLSPHELTAIRAAADGGTAGWPTTAGVGLNTLPPTGIQRSGTLRGSIPKVLERFSGVLRSGTRDMVLRRRVLKDKIHKWMVLEFELASCLRETQQERWGA